MSQSPEKRPDQAVPLVMYKSGERIVIGSAYLKGDGRIEAQIAKDVRQDLKELIFGSIGDFSINPKLPPSVDISKYHSKFSVADETVEVAYVPPLKIQEP